MYSPYLYVATAETAVDLGLVRSKTEISFGEPIKGVQLSNTTAYAAGNRMKVDGVLMVVEADDLTASNQGKYPSVLQPRVVNTRTDAERIQRIKSDFEADLLMQSNDVSTGMPTIALDGTALTNGRVIALQDLYKESPNKLRKYRKLVKEAAKGKDISGIKHPVLVRVVSDNNFDYRLFVELSNRSIATNMRTEEQALVDANVILRNNLLSLYAPGEDGSALVSSNEDFMKKFVELGGIQEAIRDNGFDVSLDMRVRHAMLATFFNGLENDKEIFAKVLTSAYKYKFLNPLSGAMAAAGSMAQLAQSNSAFDLTADLAHAFDLLADYKRQYYESPNGIKDPTTFLAQPGFGFDRQYSSIQKKLFGLLAGATSAKEVRSVLFDYIRMAKAQGAEGQMDMFGNTASAEELLDTAMQEGTDDRAEYQTTKWVVGRIVREVLETLEPDVNEHEYPALLTADNIEELIKKAEEMYNSFAAVIPISSVVENSETALLANPDKITQDARQRFKNSAKKMANKFGKKRIISPIEARFEHLTNDTTARMYLDPEKAKWVPRIPTTLQKADIVARHPNGNFVYLKKYSEGTHLVVLSRKGAILNQFDATYGLISAYSLDSAKEAKAKVSIMDEKVSAQRSGSYPTSDATSRSVLQDSTNQGSVGIPGAYIAFNGNNSPNQLAVSNSVQALRLLLDNNITIVSDKVKQAVQKKTEKNAEYQSACEVLQRYTSGKTSLNQVSAGFKLTPYEAGTTNLDIGGGRFEKGTEYLYIAPI